MNINFNHGFNKVPVGQQGTRKVKEERNAEVTGQSVQPGVVPGETVPEMATHSCSWIEVDLENSLTHTYKCSWEDSIGGDPNNNMNAAEVLKLHSMNYRNI